MLCSSSLQGELRAARDHGVGQPSPSLTFDVSDNAARVTAAARDAILRWPTALSALDKLAADGWPVLSVGAAPSGLAPHAHGFSYIVMLRGRKRWAMYAPAAGLPEPARAALPPPLLRWNASAVLGMLRRLPGAARPTICTQGTTL